MKLTQLAIPDVVLVEPRRFGDHRGFFAEVFRKDRFEEVVGHVDFVQDNHSFTAQMGSIRGLHWQKPPHMQGKLVRVTRGAIFDVAVDFREESPTYLQHVSVELSADNLNQLWIPPGFLHGFQSLTPDVEMSYRLTEFYSASHDEAIRFDDCAIAINWPMQVDYSRLSDKDRHARQLTAAKSLK
jgi:dTDP-4-dehydrorhamnose 3,5-epimerase